MVIAPSPFAAHRQRPRDIGEWEDLLVRYELGPRAVRHALEEAEENAGAHPLSSDSLVDQLAHLVRREADAGAWLQALSEGHPLSPWGEAASRAEVETEAAARTLDRFAELRARNFARVQRRGVDVWEWESVHPDHGPITAFQLLAWQVRHDGLHLVRIREILRTEPRSC